MQKYTSLLKIVVLLGVGAGMGCQSGRQATAGEPGAKGQTTDAAQAVSFKTADGWTIAGDLYAAVGKAQGNVVLLHQRGGQGSDWVPLCRALQMAHISALAIDQRGAGRSTQGPGESGENAPWPTSGDISAAIASFKDKLPTGLAGASYGANNALIYAAAHPDQIKSVALFSPGTNYHGLDAVAPARKFKGAVVIYHDKNDAIAGGGPKQITQALSGHDHILRLSTGSEHGTNLLSPANIRDAAMFFQRTLK